MSADPALVAAVRRALSLVGDPERARQQQAYMKSSLPYRGLSAPELRALLRPLLAEHRLHDPGTWRDTALELWDGASHREEWYAAIALLRHHHYRRWTDPDLVPLLLHLVRTGAWWDVVDEVASHLVGDVLRGHRVAVTPVVRAWGSDRDSMWVRRTAILAQLRHRDATDTTLLADVLDANLEGTTYGSEFFVRKAIGWALREHSRTDADWVRAYVAAHAERLAPLSRREALRLVGQTGTSSTAPTA
ncbi:DNA alkylation repair protein [Nocardioides sp. Soil805]|uniref:DNA alkylation repair protein n=1 Tax=Nocardioides sp. Soil805 TaxID=1736416 RepID=UPI00070284D4|nr:DNA alkylation repair protein [Nocardioides sp. Soil805]KRF34276.1 DNA alkylation repair protein [Nocardioides sp. Soil805]